MQHKHSYFEMIEDALITLAERKGSSRQAIWKYIATKYPEADFKQYLIRFKKVGENHNVVHVNNHRLRLSPDFRKKLIKSLETGKLIKKTQKTKATMKKTSKRKSARSNAKKTGKGSAKGKASSSRKTKKSNTKSAVKGRKVAKKGNSKTATGKNTKGSKKTQM